VIDVVKVAEA
jgi:hypothetical protein